MLIVDLLKPQSSAAESIGEEAFCYLDLERVRELFAVSGYSPSLAAISIKRSLLTMRLINLA